MVPVNLCSACGRDFGSVKAFDKHRVGDYPQTGPADYLDRMRVGLIPDHDEWDRSMGRRCLDEAEMRAAGFAQNSSGRWSIARDISSAAAMRYAAESGNA